MCESGTERRDPRQSRRGSALLAVMVVMVGLTGLLLASVALSTGEVKQSRRTLEEVKARALAESGFESGMLFLDEAVRINSGFDPMQGLEALLPNDGAVSSPFIGAPLMNGNTRVGAFSVTLTRLSSTADQMTIQIEATGYVPDAPANLPPGRQVDAWESVQVVVQYELQASDVFDYAYFINNWGWFYGNTIYGNGNVRSNGQFDAANYRPFVNGQPTYEDATLDNGVVTLSGYIDDNGDGVEDGDDGGVWAAWDIIRASKVRGSGGQTSNQHDFADSIEMPNLTDLTHYMDYAKDVGSTVKIGGKTMVSSVYGDDPAERPNLFLRGTLAEPIVLDGPIVATGDVIISGYVTGQGSIYSGGNVYVPESIIYLDGPSSPRPSGTTQAETEAWLTANHDKDFLGVFARENIVVGDYTDKTWQTYVGQWMGSAMNESSEDSGADGIPNTYAGVDGIVGTADDDVLEGDGHFTVEYYTQEHYELGLLPPGVDVGDPIPGTGEDIDGDGVFDDTVTLADIEIDKNDNLNWGHWGGNTPKGNTQHYSELSSLQANRLDGVFYTNHSFSWVVTGNQDAQINGALVSRNENIVYGTPSLQMNHDSRLLGQSGSLFDWLLPRTMRPPQVLTWRNLEADPNRYLVPANP